MTVRRRLRRLAGKAYRQIRARVSPQAGPTGASIPTAASKYRHVIDLAYQTIIGRAVEPDALASRLASLEAGTPFADMFVEIATSDEARDRLRANGRLGEKPMPPLPPAELIKLAYEVVLGRPAEPDILAERVQVLKSGGQFLDMFIEIARSDEAIHRARALAGGTTKQADDTPTTVAAKDDAAGLLPTIVGMAYEQFLRRSPSNQDTETWVSHLKSGLSLETFFRAIIDSDEARSLPKDLGLGPTLSDGAFLVAAGALVYGRGLVPQEVASWQRILDEQPEARQRFVLNMVDGHLNKILSGKTDEPHDASTCQIMGTTRLLTKKAWDERRRQLTPEDQDQAPRRQWSSWETSPFKHAGVFKVSMIASLYKGGKFIEQFLKNVTSQTAFDVAELIIIDASSPEGESAVIEQFQEQFPNIIYHRVNFRIGIYEAWNQGVELARGRYLTNTNLDDLRREDSIELQMAFLDRNPDVDVVYQDFYYTLDSSLTFHEIAAFGFKSSLPVLTPHNMLVFNSPHNAPMWRAKLHDEVGRFDTRYRSAGDYEFWLRCLAKEKTFRKLNSPHVAYFQNPEGISTRPDTRGIEEAHHILTRYSARLISPALLQSRRDFRAGLGLEAASETMSRETPYYDLAQQALMELGARRSAKSREHWQGDRAHAPGIALP
jgi:hypothetical protein